MTAAGGGNPADIISGTYFEAELAQRLLRALDAARYGGLSPTWRDELRLLQQGQHAMSDAERLAVEEIRLMPQAAWEPGHARSWRAALDSWYFTARDMLTRQHVARLNNAVSLIAGPNRMLTNAATLRNFGVGTADPVLDRLLSDVVRNEQTNDNSRRTYEAIHVHDRDRLTASYLGGLAGRGATDFDWLQWYRERVESWPADHPAKSRADIEVRGTSFRTLMERLPEYWL